MDPSNIMEHCVSGSNCVSWGSPYVHTGGGSPSGHFERGDCWGGSNPTVAPCGQEPVDGHHTRLCPCEVEVPHESGPHLAASPAPAAVSFDFTNHELVEAAYHNGEFTVTKRASSADECLPADGTFFWCQQPGSSTDNYDYCGNNSNCPFGLCCYCGGCLKYTPPDSVMGSPTTSQSTCPSGQFDNLEGTAGNPVCESCSGLSGDCDDCVCPDFTPQIEANCKAACSLPAPAPATPTYTEVRDVCRRNGNHAWSGDGEERRSCGTLKSWCDSNPSCTAYQINSGNSWCATFTGSNPPNNAGGSGGHRCWIKNAATTAFIETGTSAQVRLRRHSSAELCL